MKSRRWYIKYPQDVYALGPVEFDEPMDEKAVRKYSREFTGVNKLPTGFECWPAEDRRRK